MSLLENLYNVAVNVLRPLLPAFGAASPKVSAAVEGRRVAAGEIARWAERERDPFRPLLWLHGASAGELAGAIPVVERVRSERPGIQLLVTYSSPSAESVLDELTPDHAGYPPLETMADCREAISGSRPDALVFAKLDAWPALTRAAADAEVPLGMINATVRPSSTRLRGPGRQLLVPSYGRLDGVGAVAEGEIERLEMLGTRTESIRVTGDASFERAVMADVVEPTLRGMAEQGSPFTGVLFVGLMIVDGVPKVLEYNVRFGDPETEVLMMRLDGDLLPLLLGAARGDLRGIELSWGAPAALCVVLASEGYPGRYPKGRTIIGLARANQQDGVTVFEAGTEVPEGSTDTLTSGGRVLCVTARGQSVAEAAERAYEGVGQISFDGMQHRRDIGWQAR